MAIVYIDRGQRGSVRRWAVLTAAALALGAVLGTCGQFGSKEPSAAAASSHAVGIADSGACCGHAAVPVDALLAKSPDLLAPLPPADPAQAAAEAVAQARRYEACRRLSELDRMGARNQFAELYERDPTGTLAAAKSRDDEAIRAPCLRVGPNELRQITVLMRDAARAGNPEAKFFLLNEEVQAAAERADAADAADDIAPRIPAALAGAVEAMASTGYRPAIDLARDVANSKSMISADPVRAAAWRLVVLQLDHDPLPSDDELAASGALLELDAQAVQRAKNEAALLYGVCCQVR